MPRSILSQENVLLHSLSRAPIGARGSMNEDFFTASDDDRAIHILAENIDCQPVLPRKQSDHPSDARWAP